MQYWTLGYFRKIQRNLEILTGLMGREDLLLREQPSSKSGTPLTSTCSSLEEWPGSEYGPQLIISVALGCCLCV